MVVVFAVIAVADVVLGDVVKVVAEVSFDLWLTWSSSAGPSGLAPFSSVLSDLNRKKAVELKVIVVMENDIKTKSTVGIFSMMMF